MARSNEPIFWSLFAGGGMVAAMLMPVTVVLTGFAVVCGCLSQQALWDAVHHPPEGASGANTGLDGARTG